MSDAAAEFKLLLLEARERRGAEREAFLDHACAGRDSLRRELESLLAYETAVPSLLESGVLLDRLPATLDVGERARDAPASRPGDRIGPYTLLDVIGQGGMGIVYRVQQTTPIRRVAALKLVRRGLDTDRVVARFASERQALARMEHPGIARVLDAGASADGRPYFVMELVDGAPVTSFADRERLPIRDRVRLFLLVCQAIQHAHQKGIIHRDLKPSNILVARQDGVAVPKVIDFGIAKAIEEPVTDTLLTREGQIIGTPDYMSPEQAGAIAADVDTRTDVYALGVVLYELLCGRRPHAFERRTQENVQEVLKRRDPERPSTATGQQRWRIVRTRAPEATDEREKVAGARQTTPERLRRQLSGDLDTIVLKALQREPDRRYGSVEQLADDLRRHLEGLPVLARPDSVGYRAGKFVRRHALAVGAGGTALVLLVAFAGAMTWQARQIAIAHDLARAEQARAEAEAATATEVSDFLVSLFEVSNPSQARGDRLTAREVLDRGVEKIAALRDKPDVQARMLQVMGDVYKSLGLYPEAIDLFQQALPKREGLAGDNRVLVATTLDALGDAYRYWNRPDQAEPALRRALEIRRSLVDPAVPATSLDYAQSLNNLALVLDERRDYRASEALHREALQLRRAAAGPRSPEAANSLSNLGRMLNLANRHAEAQATLREAVALRESLFGRDSAFTAFPLQHLARSLLDSGALAEAEATAREVLRIRRIVLPPAHTDLTQTLGVLAAILRAQGRLDEAEHMAREVLARQRERVGDRHPDTGTALVELGAVREARLDFRQAETLYREALAIRREARDATHPAIADVEAALGRVLGAQGHTAEAEALLRGALARAVARLGDRHLDVADKRYDLAIVLAGRGERRESAALARAVLEARSAALPAAHPAVAKARALAARVGQGVRP